MKAGYFSILCWFPHGPNMASVAPVFIFTFKARRMDNERLGASVSFSQENFNLLIDIGQNCVTSLCLAAKVREFKHFTWVYFHPKQNHNSLYGYAWDWIPGKQLPISVRPKRILGYNNEQNDQWSLMELSVGGYHRKYHQVSITCGISAMNEKLIFKRAW